MAITVSMEASMFWPPFVRHVIHRVEQGLEPVREGIGKKQPVRLDGVDKYNGQQQNV